MGNNYNLIIFFVILGAAVLVMMSYAVARLSGSFEEVQDEQYGPEQVAYMREVRQRNVDYIAWMVRSSRGGGHRLQMSQPPVVS